MKFCIHYIAPVSDAYIVYPNNVSTNKRSKPMDFMSFLIGGMFIADILDECDREEEDYDDDYDDDYEDDDDF